MIVNHENPKEDIGLRINVSVMVRAAGSEDAWEVVSETHNRITTVGITALTKMLAGNQWRATHIHVGTGNSTPIVSQTGLDTDVFTAALDRRTHPAADELALSALITNTEANGNTLTEAGLYVDTTMISRALIFPGIVKTGAVEATIQFKYKLAELI